MVYNILLLSETTLQPWSTISSGEEERTPDVRKGLVDRVLSSPVFDVTEKMDQSPQSETVEETEVPSRNKSHPCR